MGLNGEHEVSMPKQIMTNQKLDERVLRASGLTNDLDQSENRDSYIRSDISEPCEPPKVFMSQHLTGNVYKLQANQQLNKTRQNDKLSQGMKQNAFFTSGHQFLQTLDIGSFDRVKPNVQVDPLSQQHDYKTFLKKRKIVNDEFKRFMNAHTYGREKIIDAIYKPERDELE